MCWAESVRCFSTCIIDPTNATALLDKFKIDIAINTTSLQEPLGIFNSNYQQDSSFSGHDIIVSPSFEDSGPSKESLH